MGKTHASAARGGPPRRPPTRVGERPPIRPRRQNRRRPVTSRGRFSLPDPNASATVAPLLRATEASLIHEWRNARAHDPTRAEELSQFLWTANRSLVERAANQMRGLPRAESRQVAAVALFRALEGFDGSRGVPFAAYAAYWFRKESQRARAAAMYRAAIPAHRISAVARADTGEHNTLRAIARASTLAADEPLVTDDRGPEDEVVAALMSSEVRSHVARLAPLPRRIVELRFGFDGADPRSNRAVAAIVGVSEFTVRRHLTGAFRVLRTRFAAGHDATERGR